MSYEEKIEELAQNIMPHMQFESVDEARQIAASYKLPVSDPVYVDLECMAKNFVAMASSFQIGLLVANIGVNIKTKHSAMREAICLCAKQFVAEHEEFERQVAAVLVDA